MSSSTNQNEIVWLLLEEILIQTIVVTELVMPHLRTESSRKHLQDGRYSMIAKLPQQVQHRNRLIGGSDTDCVKNPRMDRNAFGRLCVILKTIGGLIDQKFVSVEEQVAMFLSVLAHHKKNSVVKFDFQRSGQTVSYYVREVLCAILQLYSVLLAKPFPVPDDCDDQRWKWFKGCLGALDGTHINVRVPAVDRGRYRSRKSDISTNVLVVCDRHMHFVYVLPGWEGSANDARILRDSINRSNGLKVPEGNYYLCDNGYANSKGFLSPYCCVRYHLDEWGPQNRRPNNYQEHFNMRHSRARNIIERVFGIMKMRWAILRSTTYYPIDTQIDLIMACFLLHNYICREMTSDPMETLLDDCGGDPNDDDDNVEFLSTLGATPEWSAQRETLAQEMWNEFNS